MSYILWIVSTAVAVVIPAYKFNNKTNSQYLMTMAAWPMSPLVVP